MRMMSCLAVLFLPPVVSSAADRPNNPVGVHLMIHDIRDDHHIENHTAWARRVCGPWGYVKIFEYGITPRTTGPDPSQVKLVSRLYERELIPVVRLGGRIVDGIWQRPEDGPDGSFGEIAEAFKRVVAGLPLSDRCPLYIEVWNEPNLGLEWSGKPNPQEFARFYVRTAAAIRSLNRSQILISPGAVSPGGDYNSLKFIEAVCRAEPEFVRSFDYWATHPYPGATPPENNAHDWTTNSRFASIDLWVHELEVLAANGCEVGRLKVIGTETGYGLGQGDEGKMIDAGRRADYHLRSFRDYWMKWPEVLGMCVWEFAEPFARQTRSTWVHADSQTDPTGWPSMASLDYQYVAALAKPTSDYGCISGRLTDAATGGGVPNMQVELEGTDLRSTTDRFGNYILSPVKPLPNGEHHVRFHSHTHEAGSFPASVAAGQNLVADRKVRANAHATLRAQVIDTRSGGHVSDAEVTVEPGGFSARSDKEGEVEIRKIPQGYYSVVARRQGYYPFRQSETLISAPGILQRRFRLGPGEPPAQNLLTNGGFERVDADSNVALGWLTDGPAHAYRLDGESAFAGERCQQLRARPGEKAALIQWTNYSSIQTGKSYRIQAHARTTGLAAPVGKGLQIKGTVVTNAHKTLLDLSGDKTMSGDQPWGLLALEFTAPPESGRVGVRVELEADEGHACVDEIAVYPLAEVEQPK